MTICKNKINYHPLNASGNETLDLFSDLMKTLKDKEMVYYIIEAIIERYGRDFEYERFTTFAIDSDWAFHYPTGEEIKDRLGRKNKIEFKNNAPYLF